MVVACVVLQQSVESLPRQEGNVNIMVVAYIALQQSVQSLSRQEGIVNLMVLVMFYCRMSKVCSERREMQFSWWCHTLLCSRLFKICLDRRKLHFSWRWSTYQHSITPTILPSNGPSKKPCSYPSHYLDSLSSLTSVFDPSSRPLLAQTAQPTDILTGNLSFSLILKVCQERRTTCFSWCEPILQLISLMWSMEFVSQSPVLIVNNIEDHICQILHKFPSVFSSPPRISTSWACWWFWSGCT